MKQMYKKRGSRHYSGLWATALTRQKSQNEQENLLKDTNGIKLQQNGVKTLNKPKLLFVYDHQYPNRWMDGLWAAINELQKDFEVVDVNLTRDSLNLHLEGDYGSRFQNWNKYDFILGWGAFNSMVDIMLQGQTLASKKKGLCIAGNAFPPTGANNYDVLFYETKWYRPQISFHKNIVQAFGINSDIYNKPDLPFPVIWDYLGVGALANWKRWQKMGNKKGIKLVVGEYQDENVTESSQIANELLQNGVMVSPMVSPFDLANFYHWSRKVYIPADINGGGERAVWEAKACGLEVEIEPDNPKLKELLENPVQDHIQYAKKLKDGILSVI